MLQNIHNNTTNITRRVTLATNPTVGTSTGMKMVAGLDTYGFQYQIALDVLPPGVTVDMVKQGQQWFIERRTTFNRLFLFVGQFTPASQLRASTNGISLPYGRSWTNVPFTNKITVQSGSCGVTVISGSTFVVPIPGLYNVSWNTSVSYGGNTRINSSTLKGYYPNGLTGSDVLCLTSGNLSFTVQSESPGTTLSGSPIPGAISSGGWVSVTYVGTVI